MTAVKNGERDILRLHDEWVALESSGQEKGVLELCDNDVVWLVPGLGMLEGVEEVGAFLNGQPRTTLLSIDTFGIEVEVSGALAVKRARFCTTFLDEGAERRIKGAHLWTLRKDTAANQWRVTTVAWTIEDDSA